MTELTRHSLKDYTPFPWIIDTAHLSFDLGHDRTEVETRLDLRRNPAFQGTPPFLDLHGENLELIEVRVNGRTLSPSEYELHEGGLRIPRFPDNAQLETRVANVPSANTELSGLYVSDDLLVTQCEAEGFRRITYYPDRPDVMARFLVTLKGPRSKYPFLLSNGNPKGTQDLGNGLHTATWEDPFPKPAYLFALVAGNMDRLEDTFSTKSGRFVTLHAYTPVGQAKRAEFALGCLKKAMKWEEDVFGLECDLDLYQIVAVSSFNMGAMENKGLNVFNAASMLVDPQSANDGTFTITDTTVAHEYFHNYTGNRVTCRDWFQLCLKEGLTSLRDQMYSADMYGEATERISVVENVKTLQFAEDAGPAAHPVRPNSYVTIDNFYTRTIYIKGAELLHMLLVIAGREKFIAGVREYLKVNDGRAATVEEFVDCMQSSLGISRDEFMRWYSQAGTPELTVNEQWDAAKKEFRITFSQKTPATPGQNDKKPVPIPVRMALLNSNGQEMPLVRNGKALGTETLLIVNKEREEVVFSGVNSQPCPSYLRGFSAPVRLLRADTPNELLHRLAWDKDPVGRRDAGTRLFVQSFQKALEALKRGETPTLDTRVSDAYRRILLDPSLEHGFQALMLTPVDYPIMEQELDVVEPDLWVKAWKSVVRGLGAALAPDLLATWKSLAAHTAFDVDGASLGRRALKKACLRLLSQGAPEATRDAAWSQFRTSTCMEDTLAALESICECDPAGSQQAIDTFVNRWKDDSLVIRYWFTIEASRHTGDTLERVKSVARHPLFLIDNPNHARALFRAFARNFEHYHRADGAAYTFALETVAKIDGLNPDLAATLLGAFGERNWSKYDSGRCSQMSKAVEILLAKPDLSKNVREKANQIAAAFKR